MPKAMMIQLKTAFFPADQAGSSTAAQSHRSDEDESGQQASSSAPLSPDLQQLEEFFVPDGILHPKFHKPKHGRAVSLCTSRLCVEAISSYSQKAGLLKRLSSSAKIPPRLSDMVAHQLRKRVEQELELLHRADKRKRVDDEAEDSAAYFRRKHTAACHIELLSPASPASDDTKEITGSPSAAGSSTSLHSPPRYSLPLLFPDDAQRKHVRDVILSLLAPFHHRVEQATKADDGLQEIAVPSRTPELVPLVIALWRLNSFESGTESRKATPV